MIIISRIFFYYLYLIFFISYTTFDGTFLYLYLYFWYIIWWSPIYILFISIIYYYRNWWPFFIFYFLLCYYNKLEYKRQKKYLKFFGYIYIIKEIREKLLFFIIYKKIYINIFFMFIFINIYIFIYKQIYLYLFVWIFINIFLMLQINLNMKFFKIKRILYFKKGNIIYLKKYKLYKVNNLYFFFLRKFGLLILLLITFFFFILIYDNSNISIERLNFPFLKFIKFFYFSSKLKKELKIYGVCLKYFKIKMYDGLFELLYNKSKKKEFKFYFKKFNFVTWNEYRYFLLKFYSSRKLIPFEKKKVLLRDLIRYFHIDPKLVKYLFKDILNLKRGKLNYGEFFYINDMKQFMFHKEKLNNKDIGYYLESINLSENYFNKDDWYNKSLEQFLNMFKNLNWFYTNLNFAKKIYIFKMEEAISKVEDLEFDNIVWTDFDSERSKYFKKKINFFDLKQYINNRVMSEQNDVYMYKKNPLSNLRKVYFNFDRTKKFKDILELRNRFLEKQRSMIFLKYLRKEKLRLFKTFQSLLKEIVFFNKLDFLFNISLYKYEFVNLKVIYNILKNWIILKKNNIKI
jgi:hypothetical protein